MACGCLIAGYHDDGGRESMNSTNGWWAETGDWKTCVDGVASAGDVLNEGGAAFQARQEAWLKLSRITVRAGWNRFSSNSGKPSWRNNFYDRHFPR